MIHQPRESIMLILPRVRSIVVVVSVIALTAGVMLVLYGRWMRPLVEAASAAATGDRERAVAVYEASVSQFREWPLARRLAPADAALGAHNELALLYQLERYDDVIAKAPTAPPEAAPHFWAACALFKKGAHEETAEKQLEWLTRAEEEFKLALADAPEDWDTKFNYELSARLAAALRPPDKSGTQRKSVPSSLMRLLRPRSEEQRQQRGTKKVG